jgi:TPR repeat protein
MTRLIVLVGVALLATCAAASLADAEDQPAAGGSAEQGTRTPDTGGGARTPPSAAPSASSDDPTLQTINEAVRKNDCAKAVRLARPLADKGNVVGERVMGFCLGSKGMGIRKNATEAAKWLTKAADQGDATAQLLLGLAYFGGDGVKKDAGEGAKWCRKAAEQGEPRAEYMLASAYEAGIGVPKDPAQALDWYRKALAHGYEQAKADIARLEPSVSQGGASAGQARTRRSPPSGMP